MSDILIEEMPEAPIVSTFPDINPAHIFKSEVCGCGRSKRSGGPLCHVCWRAAPIDLKSDAWRRDLPDKQIPALAELRLVLGHTREPVNPDYRYEDVRPGHPIPSVEAKVYRVAAEVSVPEEEVLVAEPIAIQSPPERTPRYIVRLTENQMDRFLISASADWKQKMVQSLLDDEEG